MLHIALVEVGHIQLDAQDERLLLLKLILYQAHLLFLLSIEIRFLVAEEFLNVNSEFALFCKVFERLF